MTPKLRRMASVHVTCFMAAAVTIAVVLAASPPQAHATPPTIPCGYECKWPVGTYSVPDRIEAGEEFKITWSYSWDPQSALAAAAGARDAPDGHYAVPGRADTPPSGYAGSAVTLRLPQELVVVGWDGVELERERLWTDHYDRTMYEYSGVNGHAESGTHDGSITVRLDRDGMFYPVTALAVDLGLSVADSPPRALFAVREAAGAALFAEPPEAAASGASDAHPHRQALKWPPPTVEAAVMPAGAAAGAAGDGETYVYGYLQYNDRTGAARPAAGVRACVYDVGATASDLTPLRAGGACAQTGADGFYGVTVPREDPSGDGDADILVRFTTEGEAVTTRTGLSDAPVYLYDQKGQGGPLGATLAMGRATVPDTVPFRHALAVHVKIWEARQYVANTFGHDMPHVGIDDTMDASAFYRGPGRTINMGVEPITGRHYRDYVALHEYGHHIMYTHYGGFPGISCGAHNFHIRTTDECAWVEGWAGIFPSLVYGDPSDLYPPISLRDHELGEVPGAVLFPSPRGSDVEGSVAAILWDIYDGRNPQEPVDDIDSGAQLLWDILTDAPERGEVWPASSIRDFADDWKDAGYPSLDGVLEHNGVHAHGTATMHVLRGSGAIKAGDAATLATAGQTVRVIASVQGGERPFISFYGEAAAPMSQIGGGWAGNHAVTPATPNGPVRFVVSDGGDVTHTLHDVDPSSRVTVDRTAPAAPSAEFTAPDTIALTFQEPLAPFEAGAFAVSPPSGGVPSVSASLGTTDAFSRGDGRTVVLLSLDPAATASGNWRVSVPSSVTDTAGNAYSGDPVTAEFVADSDPPTFSAKRVGGRHIAVEFSEDVRPLVVKTNLRGYFLLADPSVPDSGIRPSSANEDWPNRRITLRFGEDTFAGTLTFLDTDGVGPIEDTLGNRLADRTSAEVASVIDPTFTARLVGVTSSIEVKWNIPVSGTTNVSEWKVNGKPPAGFGTRAGVETTAHDGTRLRLFVDGLTCTTGVLQVDYERPGEPGGNALAASDGTVVGSMGASGHCNVINSSGARFIDDRTITLELDRAVGGQLQGKFDVAGLGETIEFIEPGSRTVTLQTSSAAAANTTYMVNSEIRQGVGDRFISSDRPEPATYMDKTPPTVRRAEIAVERSFGNAVPTHVAIYFSEPLDASTLDGKVFTSGTLGEITASYLAHERALVIGHSGSVGGGPHSISIPAGIKDVNGQALEPLTVTAAVRPEITVGTLRFVDGRTLTVDVSASLSVGTLDGLIIEPSLGSIDATQDESTVTLSTAWHAKHNTEYTVSMPFESYYASGGPVADRVFIATYTDSVPPAVTSARFVSPRAIEASFSEPLDPTTLAGAAFGVEPTLGALVAEYSTDVTSVTVRTSEPARLGVKYTLVAPGAARDPGEHGFASLRIPVTRGGAFLEGAAFASPSTVVMEASAPLNSSTVGGIEVVGLGRSTASYDPSTRTVEVRTARAAVDGAAHTVTVPASVLDASGAAVGPLTLEVTHDPAAGTPRILGASTAAGGHIRVALDMSVAPAGGSPGSLDASLWTVDPTGGTAIVPTRAVAIGSDVWLLHAAAPAGTALRVYYAPSGGDGDVADNKTRQRRLAAATLPVDDLIPPTFSARTHSPTATVVTLDKAASGSTSAAEWAVEGGEVVGVSAWAGGPAPSSGAHTATLGPGATRILLHHTRISPGATPTVSYAPGVGGGILAGGEMGAGSATAVDGIAPSVVTAAFGDQRTLLVELDERPGAGAVSAEAFTVAGPGGNVGIDDASTVPHSATVTLALSANAATGVHTVTAGSAVVDIAGNGVAAGARAAAATWEAAAGGAPSFAAKTSSLTSTTVTFTPAASGLTSASSWSVSGKAATGISRVGGAEVANPGASSVTLPDGTDSIVLTHTPLHGTAAGPIVAHIGTGITSGSASLGNLAVKASDGIGPRLVSAEESRGHFRVRLSEEVTFVGDVASERSAHWTITSTFTGRQTPPPVVRLDATDASVLVLPGLFLIGQIMSYDGTGGGAGAVVDASGNGLAQFSDILPVDTSGRGIFPLLPGRSQVSLGGSVTFLPGEIPAFVIVGEDGTRIGTYRLGSNMVSVEMRIEPPLIEGHEYTMHAPGFVNDIGVAYNGGARTWVFASDGREETVHPTVESARFAGPREVLVAFSEPLRAVPPGAAFSVMPTGGAAIPLETNGVSHAVGLRTVTLSLSRDASPGAHEVRVPATVTDLAGNAYAAPGAAVPATYDDTAPTAVSAAFTGGRTVALTVSEALDARTVGGIRVLGLGATSASYAAGSTTVALHTQLEAAAGSSHAVVVPAGVTDANGVAMAPATLWAARSDTAAPMAVGARTVSPTETEVDFGEAVRLGESPTEAQHAAHWTVTEGTAARAVTGAEVVRGGLSVRLTHEAVGASATPAVSYVAGANDGASVRDWAATPNYLASTTMAVPAGDGLPPRIDSLTVSVERLGEADAPARVWARAGDTVRFAMSMSEAAGTDAPTIRLAGAPSGMSPSGEGRLRWTYAHTVPAMGAAQGALAFVVSAADGGGNLAHAEVPTSGVTPMVDTVLPSFTARTLGAGLVEVTLSEPARGTVSASDWTVGGAAATGVAASAGAAPGATVALGPEARFVLWHGGGGTGATPVVVYSPPGRA